MKQQVKNRSEYVATICMIGLWFAAAVSVLMMLLLPDKNSDSLRSKMEANGFMPKEKPSLFSIFKESFDSSDKLVFYNKKAFIRHFGTDYSEEELTVAYNKAAGAKKGPVRVVPKENNRNANSSFNSSFTIKPVPVSQ